MHEFLRIATALVVVGAACLPAAAANLPKPSPVGSWQSSDGQARVRVTLCGDGSQLCAKLTGLSGQARTAENLQLLNSYVVERARLSDVNQWQGILHFNGQTANGDIVLEGANTIMVSGCQLGMCRSLKFNRI